MVAAKGGPDPDTNMALRLAIDEAKLANVPRDNIQKAVEKGSGAGTDTANFDHLVYEAYAPGGIALIIEALTNNRNRTAPEIRTILDKNGGALANTGSVSFQFDRRGEILIEGGQVAEDKLMEVALEAGADDIQGDDTDGWQVLTEAAAFLAVKTALEKAGIPLASAGIVMHPQNTIEVSGEAAEKLAKLIDLLEDNEDVQKVHGNHVML
jgi:YebC/PmpR family DNA-binding regulatory protein